MFEGICVTTGSYDDIHKAFGLGGLLVDEDSRKTMFGNIWKDVDRFPFFRGAPGDFKKFISQWFNVDNYTQGDMHGSPVASAFVPYEVLQKYKVHEEKMPRAQGFGYLNDKNEASGFNCVYSMDPNYPFWVVSIARNASAPRHQRTITVITSFPDNRCMPLYQKAAAPKLKPQKIKNVPKLLVMLKNLLNSENVSALLQGLIGNDGVLDVNFWKSEGEPEASCWHPVAMQNKGYIVDGTILQIENEKEAYGPAEAKKEFVRLMEEAPEVDPLEITGIDELLLCISAMTEYGEGLENKEKDQQILDFSEQLRDAAEVIKNSKTKKEFDANKIAFSQKFTDGKAHIPYQKPGLREILTNILIAWVDLGFVRLVVTVAHDAYDIYKAKKQHPFFMKNTGEKRSDEVEKRVDKVTFRKK
jgi:hypothetical protein